MTRFILAELDRIALAHATFTADALALIVRASSDTRVATARTSS